MMCGDIAKWKQADHKKKSKPITLYDLGKA